MNDHVRRVFWVNQYAVAPDQPGGTRHHEMACTLRARGYDVRIVASDLNLTARAYSRRKCAKDRQAISEHVGGVPFTWLPAGSYDRNDWRRTVSMLVFAWHVWVFLLRSVRRGDVVIGSSPHLLAAGAARLSSLMRRARFVLEVRDLWPESLAGVTGRRGPTVASLRVIADVLYRTSSAIIILAEGNRESVVRHGGPPRRIVFIPNGVDATAFTGKLDEPPTRLPWLRSTPTFVYAGAHGPANGLDILLRAAGELRRRGRDDIRVLLVGDGPSKIGLQREADRLYLTNVVFYEPVAKQVIPSILRWCSGGLMILKDVDLFRFGVSPNKLFDYLAADLPVITNVPGEVARIVERAGMGVVVPPNNPSALADAMVGITDEGVASGSGMEYVRAHHDRRELVDRLERVIDAVTR